MKKESVKKQKGVGEGGISVVHLAGSEEVVQVSCKRVGLKVLCDVLQSQEGRIEGSARRASIKLTGATQRVEEQRPLSIS